jgi:hypothetical protein
MSIPNAQYNLAQPDSLAQRMTARMRRQMYRRFLDMTAPTVSETLLDVGATSDRQYDFSNYLEAWYPHKSQITATGIDDASHLETDYPGVRFVRGNARDLPFDDDSFDIVHSSAVLEHVGSRENQSRFISEAVRVARRAIFLTTPNRWFPIEVHTSIPILHWLPPAVYRALLRQLKLDFFADEQNLNLLGRGDLLAVARGAGAANVEVTSVRLLGWPSNLLLVARKGYRSGQLAGASR